jgi:penicillin-binding protein 2
MLRRTARIQQPRTYRRRRSTGAKLVLGLVLIFLITPLYRLQVSATEQYTLQAKQNRMRPVVVRAPRGTIYDRHGRVVAENIVGYQVLLMPAREDSLRALIDRLQPITGLDSASVAFAFRRYQRQRHLPMELMRDAPPEVAARLLERLQEFPGVLVQEYAKRHYPAGPAIAHFIGYISEISEREMESERFRGYEQGRWIGKAGLELQYEEHLGGVPGVQYLEIDARGRIQQFLPDTVGVPPIPGKDLHLHLDLDLQEYIYRIFPKEFTGAIVAVDPQTGGVLAYYSNPTYDPNAFIGGVSTTYYNQLRNDPAIPLLDRVVGSGQPAASTWKLALAGMALDLGVIRPDEYMPVPCTGGLFYGRYARCWYTPGHGRMNLIEGIKNSCNVYFYQLGIRIGLERFMAQGVRLGFAKKTGIDVPHEISPIFPQGVDWWVRRQGYRPNDNEVLSLAIGQGPLTMTAIKLAHIYSALTAPDGKVPAPRLAMESTPPDTFQFRLSDRDQWYLEAGMRRVVGPGGTAQNSRLVDWDFIGKTGTAQSNNPDLDHAWFVGMGALEPGKDPEIAVTMFLEYGEHGYLASGFVAEAINFYLSRKYNRPFRMYATPRLRLANGLPVNWDWFTPVTDPPIPPPEPKPQAAAPAAGASAVSATPTGARQSGNPPRVP